LLTGGGGLPSSSSEQQQQHQQQQRGKVEKKVANPLVRVLAVLLVVRPHEIATAKAEQTQAEALQELAGVASTANVRQRDVVNTAASGASQKSDKPGAEKHKKKRTVRHRCTKRKESLSFSGLALYKVFKIIHSMSFDILIFM
jgi:hypothetical protein